MNIAKRQQIELANEVTRRERIPLSDVGELLDECFGNIRRVVVARHSQLGGATVNEILDQLRDSTNTFEAKKKEVREAEATT